MIKEPWIDIKSVYEDSFSYSLYNNVILDTKTKKDTAEVPLYFNNFIYPEAISNV